MKKIWKVFLISLGSLLLLALIAVAVALWLVFTPARLTPIVNRQAARFITCQTEIDRVELTFFSSFPRLGLRADGIRLINPVAGAPCDTLLRLDRLDAAVDVKAFFKRSELILSDIVLKNGRACIFTDSLGNTNYDIFAAGSQTGPDEEGGFTISNIDADKITLNNIDVLWNDRALSAEAEARGLSAALRASMNAEGEITAVVTGKPFDFDFSMGSADSLITVSAADMSLNADLLLKGDKVGGKFTLGPALAGFAYGGEQFLNGARVEITADASADLSVWSADIKSGMVKLEDLEVALAGSVRYDTLRGVDMSLAYKLKECDLSSVLALVPASYMSYLEGIDVSGRVSAEGTAEGIYGEGSMPMIDADVVYSEGRVSYPEMLPYPLTGILADLAVHTDFKSDAESFVRVNDMKARMPRSSLRTSGMIDRLFSDPRAKLTANIDGNLADAAPFLPDSPAMAVTGGISGRVRADVRMSQIADMQFEKMKLSGSLLATNLDATYDTIAVAAPSARLDFSLPNAQPSTRQTSFAAVKLVAGDLAVKAGHGTEVSLKGVQAEAEMSDLRDTLNIPAVVCGFALVELRAGMDSMKIFAVAPAGRVSLEPGRRATDIPRIGVEYRGGFLQASSGADGVIADSADLKATVRYDESRENVWEMLMPRGHIDIRNAMATLETLAYPVELPELDMDFDPRSWKIGRAKVKIGDSDFSLDGNLDNIIQYVRGDSLLRGELNFRSSHADIPQLMMLTSGMGTDERPAETAGTEFSGPYMVPKGIDVTVHVDMRQAMWYETPLNNIRGDMWVRDGELVLDNLTLTSPATDAQVFMIYRTPRRDHLFAGASIHLLNIEFRDLLNMVPDLDSIMPMLRSFDGKGEFHFAVDTYMDSMYHVKIPTLLAEGSVTGTNLTLRDEEVFARIARYLKYKKEGVIRVDSLSAEFTIYRNEIDVYPFLIVLDRYKAVVGGRHNLDMTFDYNISLVQSPLPFRVSVDVVGNIDDLKFKLFRKSRYPDFYRPSRRYNVENKELQLRTVIRNALTRKVILQTRSQQKE